MLESHEQKWIKDQQARQRMMYLCKCIQQKKRKTKKMEWRRGNHQEGSSSNHKQSSNQDNHIGGGVGRGRGDGRKHDKSHI